MWWFHDGGWWLWVTMPVAMVAFLVAVTWAVVTLLRGIDRTPALGRQGDPEAILAERLARGEIEPEEYERRLSVLRSTVRTPT